MTWIPRSELLRDYPEMPNPSKGLSPVDAPACSPYLNRPLRRFEDAAVGREPAREDNRGADGKPDRPAQPKPQ